MEVASRQASRRSPRTDPSLFESGNVDVRSFVRSGFVGCMTGLSVCLFLLQREERMKERNWGMNVSVMLHDKFSLGN